MLPLGPKTSILVALVALVAMSACARPTFSGRTHEVNLDDPVRYHLAYINLSLRSGKRDEVVAEYKTKVDAAPKDPVARILYGRTLADDNKAFKQYQKAIELDPENYWALVGIGEVYGRMDIHQRAVESLDQAVLQRPRYAFAHAALGEVRRKKGEKDAAITAYSQAILLDPDNLVAHRGLGELYLASGSESAALRELAVAARMAPEDFDLQMKVAKLLEAAGNRAEAHAHYKLATELNSNDDRAWYGRARTAAATGLKADAIGALERVLELKSYHHLARRDLADLLREQRDFARAATLYRDAVTATPGDVDAHRGLAASYEGLSKHYEALQAYAQTLEIAADDKAAEEGRKRVLDAIGLPHSPVAGASLQQVFDRVLARVIQCYEKAKAERPELAGAVKTKVEIGEDGHAKRVELIEDGLGSPQVTACLRWSLNVASYPKGRAATVDFPVNLP